MRAEHVRSGPLASSILFAALVMPAVASSAKPDPIDDLAVALRAFRGVGHADIESYRVALTLPKDESAKNAKLEEIWRAPSDLVLRGGPTTPGAVVRSLALYLEPVYVARTAILDLDWESLAADVRATAVVSAQPGAKGNAIAVEFPDSSRSRLPEALRDVARLDAKLDAQRRLQQLDVRLVGEGGVISVVCEYGGSSDPQPSEARWTLPGGELVHVRTKFRKEQGHRLPSERRVAFPSRFDPKETEEIVVEYGKYELAPAIADSIWTARGSYRFDANGLIDSNTPH